MPCSTPTLLALLSLLSVAGAVGLGEMCPFQINKIKDRPEVNCSGQGLRAVPLALPKNTSILLLSTNRLTSVSTASFQHLPELIDLDLSDNGLSALHNGTPMPLLQELVLSHNALEVLPSLRDLPALTHLALAHNNITQLVPGDFRDVKLLRELNLRGNRLRTLPEEIFEGLAKLQDLDLSDNTLEELPQGLLAGLELETLRLSGNQLRTLPSGFFPEEHIFAYVFLAGNPWRCDCDLAYLRGWISDNDISVYMQEQRADGLLTENNSRSPVCNTPDKYRGIPVRDFQQTCRQAGDVDTSEELEEPKDLNKDETTIEEGNPVSSTTVPSTTLLPTTLVPATTAPTTSEPSTIVPSTTLHPTTPKEPCP